MDPRTLDQRIGILRNQNPEFSYFGIVAEDRQYALVIGREDRDVRAAYYIANMELGVLEMQTNVLSNGKFLLKQLAEVANSPVSEDTPAGSAVDPRLRKVGLN